MKISRANLQTFPAPLGFPSGYPTTAASRTAALRTQGADGEATEVSAANLDTELITLLPCATTMQRNAISNALQQIEKDGLNAFITTALHDHAMQDQGVAFDRHQVSMTMKPSPDTAAGVSRLVRATADQAPLPGGLSSQVEASPW